MRISYIELAGNRYPLCFSLSAARELGEAFGDFDKMQESLGSADIASQARAVDLMLNILMNAGRRYCKAMGSECPEPLPCNPSDLIDLQDPEAMKAILAAIAAGREREVEAASKKGTATQD